MGTATNRYASHRSTQEWLALFDEWAASGLTQRAFCAMKGIKPGTFGQRRRALLAQGALVQGGKSSQPAPELIELTLPPQKAEPLQTATLSSGTPPATGTGRWDLELELGPGLILRLQQR